MRKGRCVKCGSPLPPSSPIGRPRSYCGTGCRRAAELEVRRINQHIARIEEEVQHIRIHGATSAHAMLDGPDTAIKTRAAELRRLESRLRTLMTDQPDEAGP